MVFGGALAGGTAEAEGHLRDQLLIVRAVPRFVEPELLEEFLFAQIGKQQHAPAQQRLAVLIERGPGRKPLVGIVILVHAQSDLLHVVDRRRAPRVLPLRLGRRLELEFAGGHELLSVKHKHLVLDPVDQAIAATQAQGLDLEDGRIDRGVDLGLFQDVGMLPREFAPGPVGLCVFVATELDG